MREQLKRIRAARNTGADGVIRLTDAEFRQLGRAIPHTVELLDDTAKALDLLVDGYKSGGLDSADPATASILRMISRTVKSTKAFEIPALLELESKVRKSASYVLDAETEPQAEVQAQYVRR